MRPPSQRLIREDVMRLILYLNDLVLLPNRILTRFLAVSMAAKAQLRALNTKPFPEEEGRKSYENPEGFPRYSRDTHAILTPSPAPKQRERGDFIRPRITFKTQAYNQTRLIVPVISALLLTLSGCGKWNARNPMVPVSTTLTVGSVFTLPGEVKAMAAKENKLYVCLFPFSPDSSTALFYVVDASDPANPRVIGSTLDHGHYGYVYGLALYGSFAYVDTYTKGLAVLDISNPAAPKVLAAYDTLASIPVGISGMHLYAVSYGLDYLSLSDPVHPKREGQANIDIHPSLAVPWDETHCAGYDLMGGYTVLVDFSNPQVPKTVAALPRTPLNGLAYSNGSLFLSCPSKSPAMLRFTWNGGDSIREQGRANLPGEGWCLTSLGNRIVVGVAKSYYDQNLYLLSTTGPQSPYVVGECALPYDPVHLTADGSRIGVDFGSGYMIIVEVTEP
jgi:hypothetical protein